MKVAIFGATGFVGSYLVDELLKQEHRPVLLVRPGSEDRLLRADECDLVSGDIGNALAVQQTLWGVDAAIYNIGILKEYPSRGISFEALQFEGAKLTMNCAEQTGVKRFLLMSANGVKADGTTYQQTKFRAEEQLRASSLDWTIFRPSVLFGDPRGKMEFATQLYQDIVSMPVPAPLFHDGVLPLNAGAAELSPIHVLDVARVMISSLKDDPSIGQVYPLGGPEALSWKQILETIAESTGKRMIGVPTPAWTMKTVARLLDGLDILPVTADQISMLMEGNTCDSSNVFTRFGVDPIPFDAEHLGYLKEN